MTSGDDDGASVDGANADAANLLRWQVGQTHRYEVWFLTFNHRETGAGFWIRYTLRAPAADQGDATATVWFARFDPDKSGATFGIHQETPITTLVTENSPFRLSVGANRLTSASACGALSGAGHNVQWNLRWPASKATTRLLPDVAYLRGGLFETIVQSPTGSAPVTGEIIVDDIHYKFAGEPLAQSHLWGKKHAYEWVWGRCLQFGDRNDVRFEAFSTRLRRGNWTLPPMTIATLRIGNETLAFNQFRHIPWARAAWRTGHYRFSVRNAKARLDGVFTVAAPDLLMAPYVDPDGEAVWCANSEISSAVLHLRRRQGMRWGTAETLSADGTAHFETGGRRRASEVETLHQKLPMRHV